MEPALQHDSKSIRQLDRSRMSELLNAGIPSSLTSELLISVSSIARLIDRLPETLTVKFPATQRAPTEFDRAFLVNHWKEVAGRTMVAQFTADRGLRDLLNGVISAINDGNVAVATLCARAAIEGAASYDNLSQSFVGRKEKIEAQVLPFLCEKLGPNKSLYDRPMIDDLIRFQHGARLWPIGNPPETVSEWKKWRAQCRYESKQDAKKADREQSLAGQMLDALSANQRNVLTSIEKVSGRARNMAALGLYDMLSEFCHPNAANRSIGIESGSHLSDEATVVCFAGLRWTPEATKGVWLSIIGMIEAIDIHIGAHNAVHESSHDLIVGVTSRFRANLAGHD